MHPSQQERVRSVVGEALTRFLALVSGLARLPTHALTPIPSLTKLEMMRSPPRWQNTDCVRVVFSVAGAMDKGRNFLFAGAVNPRQPCAAPSPPATARLLVESAPPPHPHPRPRPPAPKANTSQVLCGRLWWLQGPRPLLRDPECRS